MAHMKMEETWRIQQTNEITGTIPSKKLPRINTKEQFRLQAKKKNQWSNFASYTHTRLQRIGEILLSTHLNWIEGGLMESLGLQKDAMSGKWELMPDSSKCARNVTTEKGVSNGIWREEVLTQRVRPKRRGGKEKENEK